MASVPSERATLSPYERAKLVRRCAMAIEQKRPARELARLYKRDVIFEAREMLRQKRRGKGAKQRAGMAERQTRRA